MATTTEELEAQMAAMEMEVAKQGDTVRAVKSKIKEEGLDKELAAPEVEKLKTLKLALQELSKQHTELCATVRALLSVIDGCSQGSSWAGSSRRAPTRHTAKRVGVVTSIAGLRRARGIPAVCVPGACGAVHHGTHAAALWLGGGWGGSADGRRHAEQGAVS
jgi:hypothetical protein